MKRTAQLKETSGVVQGHVGHSFSWTSLAFLHVCFEMHSEET